MVQHHYTKSLIPHALVKAFTNLGFREGGGECLLSVFLFVCLFSLFFSFSLFRCRGIKRKALGKQKE